MIRAEVTRELVFSVDESGVLSEAGRIPQPLRRRLRALVLAVCLVPAALHADSAPSDLSCSADLDRQEVSRLFDLARTRMAVPAGLDLSALEGVGGGSPQCIVFLTASDGGRAFTTLGRGETAERAVARAADRQALRPRRGVLWLRLGFVHRLEPSLPMRGSAIGSIASSDDLGVVGVATSRAFEAAIHPEELMAYRLVAQSGDLRAARVRGFLDRFPHRAPPIDRRDASPPAATTRMPDASATFPVPFVLRSFFDGAEGAGAENLERGNRTASGLRGENSAAVLRNRALVAGRYLVRNVGADGRFGYNYLPKSNRFADDYNILRHAGTVYSLFELYRATGVASFHTAGDRALSYLRDQFRPCPHASEALCLVEDGEIKLGGNGLAILALLEHPAVEERPDLLADARKLAAGIIALQQKDGRFQPHKLTWPGGEADDFVSIYYPGEACFALARLTVRTGERKWLDAAVYGVLYLTEVRDGGLKDDELPHDHWLAYALREIERGSTAAGENALRSSRRTYARRMMGAMVRAQNSLANGLEPPDWAGGFYRPPRSAPTSTRLEGMVAVVDLLGDAGGGEEAVCAAADYLLRTQFEAPSALFLAEPERVLGGFRRSLTDFQLRIDTSQHAVSALLGLARLIDEGRLSCSGGPTQPLD
ncbi:MAG: hypothetical protein AAF481_00345 [Acidobacteriota bacterium]